MSYVSAVRVVSAVRAAGAAGEVSAVRAASAAGAVSVSCTRTPTDLGVDGLNGARYPGLELCPKGCGGHHSVVEPLRKHV